MFRLVAKKRARKIPAIAVAIREEFPELRVECRPSTYNTDRKCHGGRIRIPGKGRKGTIIRVYNAAGEQLLSHHSGETYRKNYEVEHWVEEYRAGRRSWTWSSEEEWKPPKNWKPEWTFSQVYE